MKYPDNRDFTLITSWFNLSEDFSRIYASFYIGFAYNFISPLSIIVILEFASSGLYSWGNIYTVSVWYSFLLAIIATYLTSIYLLIYRHTSVSGTSIIAFSLSILLIFYLVIELIHIIKQAIGRTKSTQGFSYLERFLFVSYGIIFLLYFPILCSSKIMWIQVYMFLVRLFLPLYFPFRLLVNCYYNTFAI